MLVREFEGRTEREAIKSALETLNLREEDIRVESIQEGKTSFLGIGSSRPAKIRVYYNGDSRVSREAKENLIKLIRMMGIEADINVVEEEEERIRLEFESRNSGLIIGKRGKTLEAIQLLLNSIVNKGRDKWIRIVLDTEGYRSKRENTLRNLAKRMALQVKKSKRSKLLEPMNPFERRLIHLALQDDPLVETKSEGEGAYRKIRISLKR